jgi:hypothetical protein
MERPNFEDYLPKGTTIKEIQEMFKANESLYSYIQALDTYVDYFSNRLENIGYASPAPSGVQTAEQKIIARII